MVASNLIAVQGDNADDLVAVTDDGAGNVTVTADGQVYNGTGVNTVVINTGRGDDTVNYTLTGELTQGLHLVLHLSGGDDTATLDFTPGINGGGLKVDLNASDGNDTIDATFGAFTDASVYVRSNLGKHDNTFNATLLGALAGTSRVRFYTQGHHGDDTFAILADGVDIGADAALNVRFHGHKGTDNFTFTQAGAVDGFLSVGADVGDGNDTATVKVTATAGSAGEARGFIKGNKGNDTLTLTLDGLDAATVRAVLDGGQGTDSYTVSDNVQTRRVEVEV
jgi:hypothetical protein